VAALKNATLLRPRMINTYSAALQGLFDLVARMVSKNPKNRVNCQEIYDYIDNDEVFAAYRSKNIEKTQEIMLNLPPMTIVDKTSVFSVPFGIGNEKEEEYIEKIKIDKDVKRNEENHKTITKIESWALSLRLIVCYFDRLARRLFV
jgi:serine/threonine protein kinase